ncbi:MAG: hypothetical protein GX542_03620 [Rhodococcus sp.]|nr:hypothetical protein [Rhodococcus sp. (in: high G+C Gram-positive bacteria)]
MAARVPFVATIIGMLTLGLAVTLLLTTRAAEDSYQLSAARSHNQSLAEQRAALGRDVQTANSAPRLAEAATALGLVPAVDPARLVVHPDGSVEVVGTPIPAAGTPVPPLDRFPSSGAPQGNTRGESRQEQTNEPTNEGFQRVNPREEGRDRGPAEADVERSASAGVVVPDATPQPEGASPAAGEGEQLVPVTGENAPAGQ